MLIHPALVVFYVFLVFRILLVVSVNSWFIVWVGLEINVIRFIPLIVIKGDKYSNEARVKYFLTQALASVLIIRGVTLRVCNWRLIEHLLAVGVLLKIGRAPFHQWLPSLVEGVSWGCLIVLFILQKVGPLVCLTFLFKAHAHYNLTYLVIVCCSLVGRVGGLMRASLRKIMAYSSIAHLGWVISRILVSNLIWVRYYLIYSFVLISVLSLFKEQGVFSLSQLMLRDKSRRVLTGVRILSLRGLPPFSGFVPKFLVRAALLQNNVYFIFRVLLRSTFLSLFFYTRIVWRRVMLSRRARNLVGGTHTLSKGVWFNVVGLLGVRGGFIVLLNFKLFKLWAFKAQKKLP
jgi:NADH-ubiquinone oxidoreductase chain 2